MTEAGTLHPELGTLDNDSIADNTAQTIGSYTIDDNDAEDVADDSPASIRDSFHTEIEMQDVAVHRGDGSQLPNPEELKTNINPDVRKTRRRKAAVGALCLLFLSIIIIVVFSVLNVDKATLPSNTDSLSNCKGALCDYDRNGIADRAEDLVDFLITRRISKRSDLADTESPQHMAAVWIAGEDPQFLPIPPVSGGDKDVVDKFTQRYVVAVTFFSLGGMGWTDKLNFLTENDECQWFEEFRKKNGKNINLGVICHEDTGMISHLWTPWSVGLQGTLPEEMGLLRNLRSISLQYGNITGTIPSSLGDLSRLQELGLSNNALTGNVPESFNDLENLVVLALDDNMLEGNLGPILKNLPELRFLYLEDNFFTDNLHDWFNSKDVLPKLRHLDLSDNAIVGKLPLEILNHPQLRVVDIHSNELDGSLPNDIEVNNQIDFLALNFNALRGTIPSTFSNIESMNYLDLSHNKFTGNMSTLTIGLNTKLQYLFLGGNKFTEGPIPPFLESLINLRELSLKKSKRSGTIPDWIGSLTSMYLLDLDGNELKGSIPENLGNLTDLFILMLNRNQLTGQIPLSFNNLTSLEMLLLDENNITGNINFLCDEREDKIEWIAADCGNPSMAPETICFSSCCTICCYDDEPECNDDSWLTNNNPIWEHGYNRHTFEFVQDFESV